MCWLISLVLTLQASTSAWSRGSACRACAGCSPMAACTRLPTCGAPLFAVGSLSSRPFEDLERLSLVCDT